MHINDAARNSGLTAKAIRYYEGVRLAPAPARSDGGYHRYDEATGDGWEFIAIAKGAGLARRRDRRVECGRPHHRRPCRVRARGQDRGVPGRLANLRALHDAVELTLEAARRYEFPMPALPFECPLIERTLEERRSLARTGDLRDALASARSA